MKKKLLVLLVMAICFLAGCSDAKNNKSVNTGLEQTAAAREPQSTQADGDSKTLIAYFSRYGNIDLEHEVDAITSASIVVEDGEMMGNMEYMARLLQENVGGDLHFIETAEKYPSDYDNSDSNELDLQAEQEQREKARPALATHIDEIDDYDTVFLCFPNWYSDMPMAVYSFLDEYDLSGKTIIALTSSGGGGRFGGASSIQELEPDATVMEKEFTISHSRINSLDAEDIHDWLQEIGYLQ